MGRRIRIGQNRVVSRAEDHPSDQTTREAVRDLVAKGWLTHDAMWFDQTARSFGIEHANELNRAAIRAMAPIEVRRLSELLGVDRVALGGASAVVRFVTEGIRLVTPASVAGRMRVWTGGDTLCWEWEPGECFAYKGMVRLGWIDGYRCGVIYRVECWLDALGVRPLEAPRVEGCLMRDGERCAGDLALQRDTAASDPAQDG